MIDWLSNPIVTAILGFMVGMWGLIGLELWRDRRRAVRVRIMLRQEIAQNLATLTFLDSQMPSTGPAPGGHPGQVLERLVWTAQMPVLPSVLGSQEIVVLSGFYDGLLRISTLNDLLSTVDARLTDAQVDPVTWVPEWIGAGSLVEQRLTQAYADIRTLIPRTIKAGSLGVELLGQSGQPL